MRGRVYAADSVAELSEAKRCLLAVFEGFIGSTMLRKREVLIDNGRQAAFPNRVKINGLDCVASTSPRRAR